MPEITFIDSAGAEKKRTIATGMSLMRGAIESEINGIEAECGGQLACATCHVYVGESWIGSFAPAEEMEKDMLECAASEVDERSRLSCQLVLEDRHDGLVVHLPDEQS